MISVSTDPDVINKPVLPAETKTRAYSWQTVTEHPMFERIWTCVASCENVSGYLPSLGQAGVQVDVSSLSTREHSDVHPVAPLVHVEAGTAQRVLVLPGRHHGRKILHVKDRIVIG